VTPALISFRRAARAVALLALVASLGALPAAAAPKGRPGEGAKGKPAERAATAAPATAPASSVQPGPGGSPEAQAAGHGKHAGADKAGAKHAGSRAPDTGGVKRGSKSGDAGAASADTAGGGQGAQAKGQALGHAKMANATEAVSAPETSGTTPAATPALPAATLTTPLAPAPIAAPAPSTTTRPRAAHTPRGARRKAGRASGRGRVAGIAVGGTRPTVPTRIQLAPSADTRTRVVHDHRSSPAPTSDASQIEHTVTRVIQVIPRRLRIALAALIALGLALGAAAGAASLRARRAQRQRRRLAADVGLLQSALLPELPDEVGAARVAAAYRPAEGVAAGGDFYDAFALANGTTCLLMGDVAGHGRDAVPLTALVRYTLRAYLEAGLAPRLAIQMASGVLGPQLGDRIVTVVAGVYDPRSGKLTYSCAGHPPPLLTGTEDRPVTACSSPPLGTGVPTGRRQATVPLPPGAIACFFTDGVVDARLADGRVGRERLARELEQRGSRTDGPDLLRRVVQGSTGQPDDMAICLLRPLDTGAVRANERTEEYELDGRALAHGWVERFLAACGVDPAEIPAAIAEARPIVERDGSAVVCVRSDSFGVTVSVAPPLAVTLPLAAETRPRAEAPAPARRAAASGL